VEQLVELLIFEELLELEELLEKFSIKIHPPTLIKTEKKSIKYNLN
jgi:hypothetical protein